MRLQLVDRNTQLAAGSGCALEAAYSINDSGQIVGSETLNNDTDHFFLMTPR